MDQSDRAVGGAGVDARQRLPSARGLLFAGLALVLLGCPDDEPPPSSDDCGEGAVGVVLSSRNSRPPHDSWSSDEPDRALCQCMEAEQFFVDAQTLSSTIACDPTTFAEDDPFGTSQQLCRSHEAPAIYFPIDQGALPCDTCPPCGSTECQPLGCRDRCPEAESCPVGERCTASGECLACDTPEEAQGFSCGPECGRCPDLSMCIAGRCSALFRFEFVDRGSPLGVECSDMSGFPVTVPTEVTDVARRFVNPVPAWYPIPVPNLSQIYAQVFVNCLAYFTNAFGVLEPCCIPGDVCAGVAFCPWQPSTRSCEVVNLAFAPAAVACRVHYAGSVTLD